MASKAKKVKTPKHPLLVEADKLLADLKKTDTPARKLIQKLQKEADALEKQAGDLFDAINELENYA